MLLLDQEVFTFMYFWLRAINIICRDFRLNKEFRENDMDYLYGQSQNKLTLRSK